jgi:hypothetical protein
LILDRDITNTEETLGIVIKLMVIMSMRSDYVSELLPPTGLLSTGRIIAAGKTDSSTRALLHSYQQSYLVPKLEEAGEEK